MVGEGSDRCARNDKGYREGDVHARREAVDDRRDHHEADEGSHEGDDEACVLYVHAGGLRCALSDRSEQRQDQTIIPLCLDP